MNFRIVYFIATTLTAAIFVSEQKQGLIDRCLVAGVQMTEVLVAHVVNQFTILIGQTGLVFFVMLVVFKIPCQGSLPLAILISLMQGLCGMSFGKSSCLLPHSCALLSNNIEMRPRLANTPLLHSI